MGRRVATTTGVDAHVRDRSRIGARRRHPNSTTVLDTHDASLARELLDHIDRLRLIPPVISVSVMALNRQGADADSDIAIILHERACEPLDREIERIESLVASPLWRHQQEEVRQ